MMIGDIHHLGLTVRDVDASAAWYVEVLGFRRVGDYEAPDGGRRKVFLRHDGLAARLGLTQHRNAGQDLFDETRVGLDHLAFAVSARAELDAWASRLAAAGVVQAPIAAANSIPGAAVLVFRDPDNIQLELFFDPCARGRGVNPVERIDAPPTTPPDPNPSTTEEAVSSGRDGARDPGPARDDRRRVRRLASG